MLPSKKQIARILEAVKRLVPIVALASPYYGVAVAACWQGEDVQRFLEFCVKQNDQGVIRAATYAMEGKYAI